MSVGGGVIIDGRLTDLMRELDDFCGTSVPHHPPIPSPPLPWLRDVLIGVSIARLISSLEESPIRSEFQKLSIQLVKNAITRAGSDPMPGMLMGRGE